MIRGVIFDLGGVLINWSNDISYRIISAFSGVSLDLVKEGLEQDLPRVQVGELTESIWMKSFFESIHRDPPREYEHLWADTFKEEARIDFAIRDLILKLRKNVRMGALSNIEPTRLEILRLWKVPEMFDASVFSCEIEYRKPDHRPALISDSIVYQLAARKLNVEPTDCVYVDDNLNCVEGSKLAGMKGLHFKQIDDLGENLRKYGICI